MSDPINLYERTQNASHWSPKQMLEEAVGESEDCPKAMVIFLDDRNGNYITRFLQSGMSMSECLALAEVAKSNFLDQMGH